MNDPDVVEPDDLKPVGVGVTTIIEDYPFDATRMNARLAGDVGRERFRLTRCIYCNSSPGGEKIGWDA